MFWGLIMEPQRRYTQQVKKSFHISMAALDISTSSDEPAQVMCGFEGRNYLLCTLKKPDLLQCPLDLTFNIGSEVSFAANGKCHVHLTGYLSEDTSLPDPEETEEEEEEQEEEQELNNITVKSKKRGKKVLENGPPNKKLKSSVQNENENSDSDDSDSEVDVKTLLEKSLDDSDDDSDAVIEEDAEEEESEDDEDELEEEEEDSSLSEGESDGEENERKLKSKMNGVPKKQEQESQRQKKDKKREKQNIEQNKSKGEQKTPKEIQASRKKNIQGGVIIEDIREGQGIPVKNGKIVTVYYEGRLKQTNKVFDSTSKGAGFSFRLGAGDVIKGWDVGVLGMKPGGKRRIICPASMAYGQKGSPPAIPPNATLIFEVELRKYH